MPDPSSLAVTPAHWPWYFAPAPAPAAPRLRDIVRSAGIIRTRAGYAQQAADNYNEDPAYYMDLYQIVAPVAPVQCAPDTLAWIRREQQRAREEYIAPPPLPGDTPDAYPEHFLHLARQQSPGDPPMVAYTPSDAYGRADRKIRVKPGRYLAQFYPDLPNDQRIAWADAVTLQMQAAKLTITTDPDIIGQVYANGPNSCMGGKKPDYFDLPVHPATVYGAPGDLGVAYFGPLTKPTARAIVWPAKKWYGRTYGHESILETLLREEGYTQKTGTWHGARLRRLDAPNGEYILPYLDCGDSVDESDCGAFLIIARDDSGAFGGKSQSGTANDNSGAHICAHCEERYRDSDSDTYCQSCYDEHWTCDHCNEIFWSDDSRNGEHGSYCDSCWSEMITACAHCDEQFAPDDLGYSSRQRWAAHNLPDYCPDCAPDFTTCPECEEVVQSDTCDDNGRCADCHEDEVDETPETPADPDTPADPANPATPTTDPEVK